MPTIKIYKRKHNGRKKTKQRRNKRNKTRRRGGMPNGKSKTLRFAEHPEQVAEFKTILPYMSDDEESSIKHHRRCPHEKYITPGIFPCRYHNTLFRNIQEYMEWKKIKKDASLSETSHGIDRAQHLRNIRTKELLTSGRWNKPIPPEYRVYNEETGEITDARLFEPDSDEERMIIAQQRHRRNMEKEQWARDVAKHRQDRPELYYDIEPDDDADY